MSKFIYNIKKPHYGIFALTLTLLSAFSRFLIAKKLSHSPKASSDKSSNRAEKNEQVYPKRSKKISDKDTVIEVVEQPRKDGFKRAEVCIRIKFFELLKNVKRKKTPVLRFFDKELDIEKFKKRLQSASASSEKNIHIFVAQKLINQLFDLLKNEGSNMDRSRIKVYQCSQNTSELNRLFDEKELDVD